MNKKAAGIRNCIFIEDVIGRKSDGKMGPNTLNQLQEELRKFCKVKKNIDEAGMTYWMCGECHAIWYNKELVFCPNCGRTIVKEEE